MIRKKHLLMVEWDDISTDGGWADENRDFTDMCVHCKSIGWKLKSNRTKLVLAAMVSDQDWCGERQIIPRGCITSIKRLE